MKKIVLASSNAGKLQEFQHLFQDEGIQFISQVQFDISDADETAATFLENALLKARHASHYSGLPALADDSGLCVPGLQGAPGVYSARYAGEPKSDADNNQKLLQELKGKDRRAYFCCTLVLVEHEFDPMPLVFQGQWWGEILEGPQGKNGFGYDPLFLIPSLGKTAAELDLSLKNSLSHRGLAVLKLREYWNVK